MIDSLIPTPPDLLAPWRARILAALEEQGLAVAVGPHRPSGHENKASAFVRTVCLGGPWRFKQLWFPRLLTETQHLSVAKARRIDGIVARATLSMLGMEHPQETMPDGEIVPAFFISEITLASQGADLTVNGNPAVLTQADLCVQVTPIH